jgi:hypothetical protein
MTKPEPNHPLTGIRRFGTVTDASTWLTTYPPMVMASLAGDTDGDPTPCTVLAHYQPTNGDQVMILDIAGSDPVIVGALQSQAFEGHAQMAVTGSPSDFTSGTRSFLTDLSTITVPAWAMQTGNSTLEIEAYLKAIVITAPGAFELDLTTLTTGWSTSAATGDTSGFPSITSGNAGTASENAFTMLKVRWAIPTLASGASQSFVPRLNARRTAGTGALRVNASLVGISYMHWWVNP